MSKQSAYFRVEDLSGKHDTKVIKKSIDAIPGVISVSINANTNKVAVDYDTTGTSSNEIKGKIEQSGHPVQLIATQDHTM